MIKRKKSPKSVAVPADVNDWRRFFKPLAMAAKNRAERRAACPSCKRGCALMYLVHMGSRMAEICMYCEYSAAHRIKLELVEKTA